LKRVLVLLVLAFLALAGLFGSLTSSRATRGLRSSVAIRMAGSRKPVVAGERGHDTAPRLNAPENRSFRVLLPVEEAIVRQPFAPKAARIRLARQVAAMRPRKPSTHREGMGWAQPDREYWQRIPPVARQIPRDWSHLPVVRFTNSEIGGVREVRLRRGPGYDQWLLRDPFHHLTACISVHRATRRVYFMQVARQRSRQWGLEIAADQCYSCHPSGPRVIRPLYEPRVDQRTLARFNRLILSYGACVFGDSVETSLRFPPEGESGCNRCHNGVRRGRLYAIHHRPILFKVVKEETMPPDLVVAAGVAPRP
jgi:hypothetical protein